MILILTAMLLASSSAYNEVPRFRRKSDPSGTQTNEHDDSDCHKYPGPPEPKSPLHTWNSVRLGTFKSEWQEKCCAEYPGPPSPKSALHQWNSRELEKFEAQWNKDCDKVSASLPVSDMNDEMSDSSPSSSPSPSPSPSSY